MLFWNTFYFIVNKGLPAYFPEDWILAKDESLRLNISRSSFQDLKTACLCLLLCQKSDAEDFKIEDSMS